jgi:hypothetical protein
VQSSPSLTVGAEANGQPANSVGRVKLTVIAGTPGTSQDEADVALALSLTDVRQVGTLLDYAGELQMRSTIRITDRASGDVSEMSGTVEDLEVPVDAPCAITVGLAAGSTCGVTTSLDAVLPGIVDEGERSIWELGQVEVLDGGPDGVADTPNNSVFARQGVFVP